MTIYRNAKKAFSFSVAGLYDRFAVTLTLNPKFTQYFTHVEQYEITMDKIINIIQCYPASILKFHINAELTKSHNIHYHFAVETAIKLKLSVLKELMTVMFSDYEFGFHYCKPIYNLSSWIAYLYKEPYFIEHYKYAFDPIDEL